MGYDVHITCKENWHDEDMYNEISLAEWLQYARAEKDLEIENTETGTIIWNRRAWLYWHKGNISVKNPDEGTLLKMITIAEDFLAGVQGDDGEFYIRSSGGVTTVEEAARLQKIQKRWASIGRALLFMLILLVLVFFINNALFK